MLAGLGAWCSGIGAVVAAGWLASALAGAVAAAPRGVVGALISRSARMTRSVTPKAAAVPDNHPGDGPGPNLRRFCEQGRAVFGFGHAGIARDLAPVRVKRS